MENFIEIKEEIIKRQKVVNTCEDGKRNVLAAKNIDDLLTILKDNFKWSFHQKIIDIKLLTLVGQNICNENDVYFNVSTDSGFLLVDSGQVSASGYTLVIAYGTATVKASGFATVIACEGTTVFASGGATVLAHENANINVCENASFGRWEI